MVSRFVFSSLGFAALVACGSAAAAGDTALPSFATSGCEAAEGYDAGWQGYGNDFGFDQPAGEKRQAISGFYQLRGHGDKLYAAFGGAFGKGVTPGALLVLDADTLALERTITLPFMAHALAVNAAGTQAVVSHTRATAFSVVDLPAGTLRCFKPDVKVGEDNFFSRYVTYGEGGNFFISYFNGGKHMRSVVVKYGTNGQPAPGYALQVTEASISLPAFYRDGVVFTGGKGVQAVSGQDGSVQRIIPPYSDWNIFNYAQGPGSALLATNSKYEGYPNLLQIEPGYNGISGILTGRGSLEAQHVPERSQVFVSNFESNTVSVAAVDGNGKLSAGEFVNIAFSGQPLGLYARATPDATEVFVAIKYWGEHNATKAGLLHKIRIAGNVRGIEGIAQPGACTVQVFDLRDQSVSKPEACQLLNAKASYAAIEKELDGIVKGIEQGLKDGEQKLQAAQAALQQAKVDKADAKTVAEREKATAEVQKTIESGQHSLREATVDRAMFGRLAAQ